MLEVKEGNVFENKEVGNADVVAFYDKEYHIKLSTDKETILADGTDQATITAKIYNYEDQYQVSRNDDIMFSFDGMEQIVTAVDGQAGITFDSDIAGTFTISASVDGFRSGSVEVMAE